MNLRPIPSRLFRHSRLRANARTAPTVTPEARTRVGIGDVDESSGDESAHVFLTVVSSKFRLPKLVNE